MTATRLTPKDVYELYLRVWPDDDPWPLDGKPDQRQLDIVAEVRAMRAAPSLAAAPLCPRCANRDNCCVATLDRFHDYDFARCKMFVEEFPERRTR